MTEYMLIHAVNGSIFTQEYRNIEDARKDMMTRLFDSVNYPI